MKEAFSIDVSDMLEISSDRSGISSTPRTRHLKWQHKYLSLHTWRYKMILLLILSPYDMWRLVITASIVSSETCRYLIYSEADFEVFRHAGVTRCTDGGEIWHGGGDLPSSMPNFTPIGATIRV